MDRSKAAARTRLLQELAKTRHSSSPRDEDFATAGSFDFDNDAVIHSTAQMGDTTAQHARLSNVYRQGSVDGTEGSTEMSIEMGRGHKRTSRHQQEDVSSNAIFNLGDDSLYEVTATPPIKPRSGSTRLNGALRKEASVRGASQSYKSNDAVKRTASGAQQHTLAEALGRMPAVDDTLLPDQPTNTAAPRNSRFTRTRYSSAPEPARLASKPINQTATYTANSFILPDLPNIAELVSGTRKDGTPVFQRTTKSKSRFASGSHQPLQPEHAPVERVPIPAEEQAIYTSLQLLKEKVAQLEMEKSEAESRADRYENEVVDLRMQLQLANRRPDSALGSDIDDAAFDKLRGEKTRLQASFKALQDRFNRAEQKQGVSQITIDRVVQEREKLITQIGIAYHENEQLKEENDMFRESYSKLQAEQDELRDIMEQLNKENRELRKQSASKDMPPNRSTGERRSSRQIKPTADPNSAPSTRLRDSKRKVLAAEVSDHLHNDDIALRIAKEVQKNRDGARADQQENNEHRRRSDRARSRSTGRTQHDEQVKRVQQLATAPTDETTEFEVTGKTFGSIQEARSHRTKPVSKAAEYDQDITILSDLDPLDCAALRKRIEEEYRANRHKRSVSAAALLQREDTAQNALPRKTSLRDLTVNRDFTETTKTGKFVRVQSPHTSDDAISVRNVADTTEMSAASNTSRRRRAVSAEGMTSAFIVPDITIRTIATQHINGATNCIQHKALHCTICRAGDKDITIPKPVPVSQRAVEGDPDITSATVRPAQAPPLALATVIKQLEDEITHLKLELQEAERRFSQHIPALSKRRRELLNTRITQLRQEVNRRMDQVYALYDVLEGQKQAAEREGKPYDMATEEVEETLMSIGLDPVEISGRIGRGATAQSLDDVSSEASDELPWEGLSEYESEQEQRLWTGS